MKTKLKSQALQDYCEFLTASIADLDAIIFHIESIPFAGISKDDEREIRFDSVPFLKKVKEAKRAAESSIHHYTDLSA